MYPGGHERNATVSAYSHLQNTVEAPSWWCQDELWNDFQEGEELLDYE